MPFPPERLARLLAVIFFAVAVCTPAPALAQTLVGNLGESHDGDFSPLLGQWYAAVFVTDGAPRTLLSVRVEMDPGQFPEPTVSFARIYADDGAGLPGAVLVQLTNPPGLASTEPLGIYEFTSPSPLLLAANTRYYVNLGSLVGGPGMPDQRAFWSYTFSDNSTGPGTLLGGSYRSFDQGGTWEFANPTRNAIVEVNAPPASSVPALSHAHRAALLIALLGVSCVFAYRRPRANTEELRARDRCAFQ